MPRILHWFRNDLRIHDNPALTAAANDADGDVIACFVIAEAQWQEHDMAPIKADFLLQNLKALHDALAERGVPLLVIRGERFTQQPDQLLELAEQSGCERIYFNEEYALNERRRDRQLKQKADNAGIKVKKFRDQSILPVGVLRTQQDDPYTVFSPFKRTWWKRLDEFDLTLWQAPKGGNKPLCDAPPEVTDSVRLSDLTFDIIGHKDSSAWPAGEQAAHERLEMFLENSGGRYHQQRDLPAIEGTSQLSPYLALGVLSGKQCFQAASQHRASHSSQAEGIDCWINELIWRDFYINIIHDFPRVSMHRAFKPDTEQVVWRQSDTDFQAWCEGRTGIPIVDAAMRQLNQTGWMHNRLRMICAMFLSKNLLLDWRLGERYFMQNLIDGYLPANNGGWQWSASTGTDAAPYFRVFNPVTQGERFDPDGVFVRRFVPELKALPDKKLHHPLTQKVTGINYPTAIVDLKSSRQRAIDAFRDLKQD